MAADSLINVFEYLYRVSLDVCQIVSKRYNAVLRRGTQLRPIIEARVCQQQQVEMLPSFFCVSPYEFWRGKGPRSNVSVI